MVKLTQKIAESWVHACQREAQRVLDEVRTGTATATTTDLPDFMTLDPRLSDDAPDLKEISARPYNPCKCRARTFKGGWSVQCTRSHLDDKVFCKTHLDKHTELSAEGYQLRFGYYDEVRPNNWLDKADGNSITWTDTKTSSKGKISPNPVKSSSTKLKKSELKEFLSSRIPNERLQGLLKTELLNLYDKEKAKDLKTTSSDSDKTEPLSPHPSSPTQEDLSEMEPEPEHQPTEYPPESDTPVEVEVQAAVEALVATVESDIEVETAVEALVATVESDIEVETAVEALVATVESDNAIHNPTESILLVPDNQLDTDVVVYSGDGQELVEESSLVPKLSPSTEEIISDMVDSDNNSPRTVPAFKKKYKEMDIPSSEYNTLKGLQQHREFWKNYNMRDNVSESSDEEREFVEMDFDGVEYLEDENSGDIFNTKHQKIGKWNDVGDEVLWLNDSFRTNHETMKD
jgi:hypothetical protein